MTGDQRLALSRGSLAPAHARAWITEQTVGMPEDVVSDALLVVSELVTNAVRHGQAEVELILEHVPVGIRISVSDQGEAMPIAPDRPPDLDGTSGRGLLIVAATASTWGVDRHSSAPGKTVWAELRDGADGTAR